MKRTLLSIIVILFVSIVAVGTSACNKEKAPDYQKDNDFGVSVYEDADIGALVYKPNGVKAKYGVLFYVATITAPEYYDYLATALAKQGYLVVFPRFALNLAYFEYKEDGEPAFSKYSDVKFFVGGHSQGGGAAVRRVEENADKVAGCILFAPLCLSHSAEKTDESGNTIVYNHLDSLADTSVPTLLLEADRDVILTSEMKHTTLERINPAVTQIHTLSDASHMGFTSWDDFDISQLMSSMGTTGTGDLTDISPEQKQAQRELTVRYTLEFVKNVVK